MTDSEFSDELALSIAQSVIVRKYQLEKQKQGLYVGYITGIPDAQTEQLFAEEYGDVCTFPQWLNYSARKYVEKVQVGT